MKNKESLYYKEALRLVLPDAEQIRRNVLHTPPARARKKAWIPVLAGVAAAALICVAVPPARAAIAHWFNTYFSVQEYVSQPSAQRIDTPELQAIIDQTTVQQPESQNTIEYVNMLPEWQAWADTLQPSVGDIYFDGAQIIASIDLGGGVPEFIGSHYNSIVSAQPDPDPALKDIIPFPDTIDFLNYDYVALNDVTYALGSFLMIAQSEYDQYQRYTPAYTRSENALPRSEWTETMTSEGVAAMKSSGSLRAALTIPLEHSSSMENYKSIVSPEDYASWQKIIEEYRQFDPEYDPESYPAFHLSEGLNGVQQVEINIPLLYTDLSRPPTVTEDQQGYSVEYDNQLIGILRVKFSFDPAAGNASHETIEINETVEFKGNATYAWADWNSDPQTVTFVNKTTDMAGVSMSAKRLEITPSGTKLYMSLNAPDDWDALDKSCFLGNLLYTVEGDGVQLPSAGEQFGLEEADEDIGFCITLNLLPSEVKNIDTFRILPRIERFSGYDEVPFVEGKPTVIPQNEVHGWQLDSTDLPDCALTFRPNRS